MRVIPAVIGGAAAVVAVAGVAAAVVTPAHEAGTSSGATSAASTASPHGVATGHATAAGAALQERPGEQIVTLSLPGGSYTPQAPAGGTDDYRCFVLDLPAGASGYATGFEVVPGNPDVTHHAILYKVYPEQVAGAAELDAADDRPGYECFGGSGLPRRGQGIQKSLNESDWITAWAPGGDASDTPDGYGVEIPDGGKVVLQMHYNTRKTIAPDNTLVRLRMSPADSGKKPLYSMLMAAPVELPCVEGQSGPLCDRDAAIADVVNRFGRGSGAMVAGLHMLCQSEVTPGPTQSCSRTITEPATVFASAGHMHLLGRSITIDVNAGTPSERRILDVPAYDFDRQDAVPLSEPYQLNAGDRVTVTCTHDNGLRGKLPGVPDEPRYVVWGEGTTDEMCLGVLITGKDA